MTPRPGIARNRVLANVVVMPDGLNPTFDPRDIWELLSHDFDDVIDVRSPSEYRQDHISGSVNLPVLADEERKLVGTVYSRESQFKANRIGAGMIARNMADILEGCMSDRPRNYRPLVYCWRGGKRSRAFAEICNQVGWRVATLSGGYRAYRKLVGTLLYTDRFPFRIVLVAGPTGSAKTAVINHLAETGVQTIDLEWCASHKGSVFGGEKGEQPSQKRFESRITACMSGFDQKLPVIMEAESRRIGKNTIPPSLWEAMMKSLRINLSADITSRTGLIIESYNWLTEDTGQLHDMVGRLDRFHSHEVIMRWQGLVAQGNYHDLVTELLKHHYDPLYERSACKATNPILGPIEMTDVSQGTIRSSAARIKRLISEYDPVS